MLYYRHRRGFYALAEPPRAGKYVRLALGSLLLIVILYFAGSWLLRIFGIGNSTRQTGAILIVERSSAVQVSIEGKEFINAQDGIKLYAGDSVKTGGNGTAALRLFDGSVIRINNQSTLSIDQSDLKRENSVLHLKLAAGEAWISTPTVEAFTGSIIRTIDTADLTFDIPAHSDALINQRSVAVFSAAGLGIKISIPRADIPVIVGEGQQYALPPSSATFDPSADLYQYRSPIDALNNLPPFVVESRSLYTGKTAGTVSHPTNASGSTADGSPVLSVTSPTNNTAFATQTVRVEGKVSPIATSLRVNGYKATIGDEGTFGLDVTPPDGDQTTITIEALDAQGNVLDSVTRSLTRDRTPVPIPSITAPAAGGQTFRTRQTKITIKGTAPQGTAGIIVNDYRLQLFQAGQTEWSYLASTDLQNLIEGENVFTVYALNQAGVKSEPVTLKIIVGPDVEEGVVQNNPSSATGTASSVAPEVNEKDLPNNAPLLPGTIVITAPTPGARTESGSSFLLEGTAPQGTATVWVNGYRLRLYLPGKPKWNYLADFKLGTLKAGENSYVINARNADGQILDTLTFRMRFEPAN